MKTLTRIAVALVCVGSVFVPFAVAQTADMTSEITRAASASLDQVRRAVEEQDQPGLLGLDSTRELDQIELGTPVAVDTLSYNALLGYRPDKELSAYFEGPDRAVVPVKVGGRVRSWVSLSHDGERWQTTGFGERTDAVSADEVGREIFDLVTKTAAGEPTASERLGHQEFILTYKSFEPIGPECLP